MEQLEARKDRASLVKNSGRGHEKGDAKSDGFLIDYKFNAKSFSLSLENWKKLENEAWKDGFRDPVISIVFADGTKVAIVDWQHFQDYHEMTFRSNNDSD